MHEDSDKLRNFKKEVIKISKLRHSNLILFSGACLEASKCSIVMSLCRGVSLYKYLHNDSYVKPNFDWVIDIATQIVQGMGFLHSKNIIHKDLKSKNIFIDDDCKAIITDFGLNSINYLCSKKSQSKKIKLINKI
jgi:kinase suppressor of Ras 2